MKLSKEAVELLNSLERYTVLKALEEGKQLVTRVLQVAGEKSNDGDVDKAKMQDAIRTVVEELEQLKQKKTPF